MIHSITGTGAKTPVVADVGVLQGGKRKPDGRSLDLQKELPWHVSRLGSMTDHDIALLKILVWDVLQGIDFVKMVLRSFRPAHLRNIKRVPADRPWTHVGYLEAAVCLRISLEL